MMEGIQKIVRDATKEFKLNNSTSYDNNIKSHEYPPQLLLTRPPRNMLSLWTCSKVCALFFVAGVVVGYTLKRRVRRWASRILRRFKDD